MIRDHNLFRQEYKHAQGWWEDLRFPASITNVQGINPPDFDTDNGTLLFASNKEEEVFYQAQLPHAWVEGSRIEPHVHWAKTSSASGGVIWQIEYVWTNVGDIFPIAGSTTTTELSEEEVSDADTQNLHAIKSGEILGTGKKISSMLLIRLYRDVADAGDTYGADARLVEFDIHYQIDQPGSTGEYNKWNA